MPLGVIHLLQADLLQVHDPRAFEPAKVNHVVHVLVGVLVAPLHRQAKDGRVFGNFGRSGASVVMDRMPAMDELAADCCKLAIIGDR